MQFNPFPFLWLLVEIYIFVLISSAIFRYTFFWLLLLAFKFTVSYLVQVCYSFLEFFNKLYMVDGFVVNLFLCLSFPR